VKNPNVKLNAQIKAAKCSTAQNVLLYANNPIASLIAKLLNQNANQYAKNQNVTGNAKNQLALNQNVSWYVKIQIVFLKLSAAHAI
jgi:hypothetical protein